LLKSASHVAIGQSGRGRLAEKCSLLLLAHFQPISGSMRVSFSPCLQIWGINSSPVSGIHLELCRNNITHQHLSPRSFTDLFNTFKIIPWLFSSIHSASALRHLLSLLQSCNSTGLDLSVRMQCVDCYAFRSQDLSLTVS
jgi:hypothetical protein